jgi:cytidine deaminase
MNEARFKLIEAAKAVCGEFRLREDFSAGVVGAAILTARGNIYTGICIDLACGLGFCAEVAAVAEMLKARETHILAVVAVSNEGSFAAPCGRCRETIAQVDSHNLDCASSWETVGKFYSGSCFRNTDCLSHRTSH